MLGFLKVTTLYVNKTLELFFPRPKYMAITLKGQPRCLKDRMFVPHPKKVPSLLAHTLGCLTNHGVLIHIKLEAISVLKWHGLEVRLDSWLRKLDV